MRKLKEVTIEINQKCKSNCLFCSSFSGISKTHEIPKQKIFEVLQFCKKKGAKTINLSGGEPLLNKDLCDILNFAGSLGIKITIYTSGNVSDLSIFQRILETDIQNSDLKLIFNYPSSRNDVFQTLINDRSISVFNIDKAIEQLVANSIKVEAHIVPNSLNTNYLVETVNHLKTIGVTKVSLLRMVFQGRAEKNKKILEIKDNTKLISIINHIKKEICDKSFNLRVGIPFSNLTKNKCECFAGYSKLIFRYDGVVFPCEAFKEAPDNKEYELGNVYTNDLDDLWSNHPVHRKLQFLKQEAFNVGEVCPAQILYSK